MYLYCKHTDSRSERNVQGTDITSKMNVLGTDIMQGKGMYRGQTQKNSLQYMYTQNMYGDGIQ